MVDQVRILVVDDEAGLREMMAYELAQRGYSVLAVANGEEALQAIQKERFPLVVSDIMMPKMDGLELLGQFRKIDPDMEVVLVTGFATVENAVQGMKQGAYDFLPKPFDLDRLESIIKKALSQRDLKSMIGVYESGKAVFSSMDRNKVIPAILEQSKKVLQADQVVIFLQEESKRLSLFAEQTLPPEGQKALEVLIDSYANQLYQKKEAILITREKSPRPGVISDQLPTGIGCLALFPLAIGTEYHGILAAIRSSNQPYVFSQADVRYGSVFSAEISQALSNSRLLDRLAKNVAELEIANQKLAESQRQLLQSEKLAAIGELSAGVAHELNNPLTGILGFSQLLLRKSNLAKEDRDDIEGIYKESVRCRQIIRNLLKFSRQNEKDKKECLDPVALVQSTLDLVNYDVTTSAIEIVKELPAGMPLIWGDSQSLRQVFINIITNAKHAMEGRAHAKLIIRARAEAAHVLFVFQDNGSGIPKDKIGKIFDPFFTTKPPGKGTGLGLSVSYGIIKDHNGTLTAESEEGVGTKMMVRLPIYQREA